MDAKQTEQIPVYLVIDDAERGITQALVGRYGTRREAMEAAERAAGEGAEFSRQGLHVGCTGASGRAWLGDDAVRGPEGPRGPEAGR